MSCTVLETLRRSKAAAKLGVKNEIPLSCTYEGCCSQDLDACLQTQTPLTHDQLEKMATQNLDGFYSSLAITAAIRGTWEQISDQLPPTTEKTLSQSPDDSFQTPPRS